MRNSSFFSIANLLSLSRIPLAMLFAVSWLAPRGGSGWALAVLAVAAATDALDGIFARRAAVRAPASTTTTTTTTSTATMTTASIEDGPGGGRRWFSSTPAGTGSWLDPICDKIFVATVLVTIWIQLRPPVSLLAMILARELAQVPLSLLYVSLSSLRKWLRYDFRASALGKAATVSQFAAIAALVLRLSWTPLLAWISFATGMLALADYLWRAVRMGKARLQVRSAGECQKIS